MFGGRRWTRGYVDRRIGRQYFAGDQFLGIVVEKELAKYSLRSHQVDDGHAAAAVLNSLYTVL